MFNEKEKKKQNFLKALKSLWYPPKKLGFIADCTKYNNNFKPIFSNALNSYYVKRPFYTSYRGLYANTTTV